MALAVSLLPREMPVTLICVRLWMLLSSGEGFVADDGEGTAEVCVQLMFDVLPWALLRFLPSALPPALMASAHLCHSPCTQTQARVQPVCQGDIGEIKI